MVPKLQEQTQELSAKVSKLESLNEESEKELNEKKKEVDELHDNLKVCSYS